MPGVRRWVRTLRASWPLFAAVSITVVIVAEASAPHRKRNPPLTLRWMTDLRKARSQADIPPFSRPVRVIGLRPAWYCVGSGRATPSLRPHSSSEAVTLSLV